MGDFPHQKEEIDGRDIIMNLARGKRLIFLVAMFCLATMPAFGINIDSRNPRALALGGGAIALTGMGLGTDNPASLAQTNSALSYYYNNFYGFKGYEIKGGNFTVQTKLGTLGFVYDSEGISLFEERMGSDYKSLWEEKKLAFGYASAIRKMNFGLAILHANKNVYSDYEENEIMKQSNLLMNLGLQLNGERFGIGCTLKNLGGDIEPAFGLGLRYGDPNNFVAILDLLQGQNILGDRHTIISGGLEAWVRDNFALRISLDKVGMVSVGLGASSGRIKVDYAYQIHPVGNTHYFATSYLF